MRASRASRRWFGMVAILIAAGGCTNLPPPRELSVTTDYPIAAWASVLERFVDVRGQVDFGRLAHDRADLDRYVAWIYANGPQHQPSRFATPSAVLAYHLNAYNALAMYQVLAAGIPKSLEGVSKIRFFLLTHVRIDGEPWSLYSYENDVIRALGEPRVHFALNCMAVSCPRLPRAPFDGARLETQLETAAKEFFNEARNVHLDHESRTVYLSAILDFYPQDFLAVAPSLIAYVNRYREDPIPAQYRLAYVPYSWTVNRQ